MHGDIRQSRRNRVLEEFKTGKVKLLIASDLAARGIDVDGITHVVNYDIPDNPDDYVHRMDGPPEPAEKAPLGPSSAPMKAIF